MHEDLPFMIQAVKQLAQANYDSSGWDFIVECYTDEELGKLIESYNPKSIDDALINVAKYVRCLDERRRAIQAEIF